MNETPIKTWKATTPPSEFDRFVDELVLERLVKFAHASGGEALTGIDAPCGDGRLSRNALSKLRPNSRLIAVDDDREALERLHEHAPHPTLFARKERLDHLPFDESVFDFALYAHRGRPIDIERLLRQIWRSLKNGGQLIAAVPLRETVFELLGELADLVAEPGEARFDTAQSGLLLAKEWRALLTRLGTSKVEIGLQTVCLDVSPPASQNELFWQCVLPLAFEKSQNSRLLEKIESRMTATMSCTLHFAAIAATRA